VTRARCIDIDAVATAILLPMQHAQRNRIAVGGLLVATLTLGGGLAITARALPLQSKGDTVTVTRKTTKLRNAKRAFAPAVASLTEGDRLVVVAKDGAWLQVTLPAPAASTAPAVQGYVHAGDVSAKKEVVLSGQGVRETYSSSETAAARKGFNPEVEKEYRAGNPQLEAAFTAVDRIQARAVSEVEVQEFLLEGGLVGEGAK
jgi:hypothetical protein